MKTLITLLAVALLVLSACGPRTMDSKSPRPSAPSAPTAPADSSSPEPVAAVGTDLGDLDSQLSDDLGDFDSVSTDLAELENLDY